MNDAASEPALIQELELRTDVVRQCALAAPHHDRPEEQLALVDQTRGNRLASELGTPDRNVRFRGLLEPPDRIWWKPRSIGVLALETV